MYFFMEFGKHIFFPEVLHHKYFENFQLKNEVARYKRKCKESNLEINKLRKDLEEMKTAEIKALQVKKESAVNKHISSASNMAANNPNW